MTLLIAAAAAVLTGVMFWVADLPLRPAYWSRKREKTSRETTDALWSRTFSATPDKKKSKKFDMLFLADITPKEFKQQRMLFAGSGFLVLGGITTVLAGPIIGVVIAVGGAAGGWFLPVSQAQGKAKKFKFELQQALPQFLSLTAMAMTSLSLTEAIRYAASASDHRSFLLFHELIPPLNSTKTFGDAMFDFGKRYQLPEISNRGTILRTAAKEGGENIRATIQQQAIDCRKSTNAAFEAEVTSRVAIASSTPLAILISLFIFILYPVSQQVGNIDTGLVDDAIQTTSQNVDIP